MLIWNPLVIILIYHPLVEFELIAHSNAGRNLQTNVTKMVKRYASFASDRNMKAGHLWADQKGGQSVRTPLLKNFKAIGFLAILVQIS